MTSSIPKFIDMNITKIVEIGKDLGIVFNDDGSWDSDKWDGAIKSLDDETCIEFVDHELSRSHISASIEKATEFGAKRVLIICSSRHVFLHVAEKMKVILAPYEDEALEVKAVSWPAHYRVSAHHLHETSQSLERLKNTSPTPSSSRTTNTTLTYFPTVYKKKGLELPPKSKSHLTELYPRDLEQGFLDGIMDAWNEKLLTDDAGIGRMNPPVILREEAETGTGMEISDVGDDKVFPLIDHLPEALFLQWSWILEGPIEYYDENELPNDWISKDLHPHALSDECSTILQDAFHRRTNHPLSTGFRIDTLLGRSIEVYSDSRITASSRTWVYPVYSINLPSARNWQRGGTCFCNGMGDRNIWWQLLVGAGHTKVNDLVNRNVEFVKKLIKKMCEVAPTYIILAHEDCKNLFEKHSPSITQAINTSEYQQIHNETKKIVKKNLAQYTKIILDNWDDVVAKNCHSQEMRSKADFIAGMIGGMNGRTYHRRSSKIQKKGLEGDVIDVNDYILSPLVKLQQKLELEPISQPIAQASQISVCAHYIEPASIHHSSHGLTTNMGMIESLLHLRGYDSIPRENCMYSQGCIEISTKKIYDIARRVQSQPYAVLFLYTSIMRNLGYDPGEISDGIHAMSGVDTTADEAKLNASLIAVGAVNISSIVRMVTALSVLSARYEAHVRAGNYRGLVAVPSPQDSNRRYLERALAIGLSWNHKLKDIHLREVLASCVGDAKNLSLIANEGGDENEMWTLATIIAGSFKHMRDKDLIVSGLIMNLRMSTESQTKDIISEIISGGKRRVRNFRLRR